MDDFTLDKPKYDLGTYFGRLQYFLRMTDPMNLLESEESVRKAESAIQLFRRSGTLTGSSTDMWKNLSIVNSAIHPASKDCCLLHYISYNYLY